jgi:DNA-binding GntR family transcriptional regulator
MSDMSVASLQTVSVVDALVAALRARILDGDLPGGASVAEVEVAREFGVARPTAKTAIRSLVHDGLLRQQPNRAAHVPVLTNADIKDVFLARTPLELAVVRQLAEANATAGLSAAAAAVASLRGLADTAPTSEFVAADLGFHRGLIDAARSPRLSRIYALISGEIHLCMTQTRRTLGRDRIANEHAKILGAIQAGRTERAGDLMRQHLDGALGAMVGALGRPSR